MLDRQVCQGAVIKKTMTYNLNPTLIFINRTSNKQTISILSKRSLLHQPKEIQSEVHLFGPIR